MRMVMICIAHRDLYVHIDGVKKPTQVSSVEQYYKGFPLLTCHIIMSNLKGM